MDTSTDLGTADVINVIRWISNCRLCESETCFTTLILSLM